MKSNAYSADGLGQIKIMTSTDSFILFCRNRPNYKRYTKASFDKIFLQNDMFFERLQIIKCPNHMCSRACSIHVRIIAGLTKRPKTDNKRVLQLWIIDSHALSLQNSYLHCRHGRFLFQALIKLFSRQELFKLSFNVLAC